MGRVWGVVEGPRPEEGGPQRPLQEQDASGPGTGQFGPLGFVSGERPTPTRLDFYFLTLGFTAPCLA